MHETLSQTPLKETVAKDIPTAGTLEITYPLVWDNYFRSYTDIVIAKTGRLTVNGDVWMPKKSSIEVSGHLYLRNADIRRIQEGEKWNGIRVKSGGVLWLENTQIDDYDIIVEAGATLVLDGRVLFGNGHAMVINGNNYVCVGNPIQSTRGAIYVESPNLLRPGVAPGTSLLYRTACGSIGTPGWSSFLSYLTMIDDIDIQNVTLSQDTTYVGSTVKVGRNVTTTKPQGPVTITNGARIRFLTTENLLLEKGFTCQQGAFRKEVLFP